MRLRILIDHCACVSVLQRLLPFAKNSILFTAAGVVARTAIDTVDPTVKVDPGAGVTISTVGRAMTGACTPLVSQVIAAITNAKRRLIGSLDFGPSGLRKKLKLISMRVFLPKLFLMKLFWFIVLYRAASSAAYSVKIVLISFVNPFFKNVRSAPLRLSFKINSYYYLSLINLAFT